MDGNFSTSRDLGYIDSVIDGITLEICMIEGCASLVELVGECHTPQDLLEKQLNTLGSSLRRSVVEIERQLSKLQGGV